MTPQAAFGRFPPGGRRSRAVDVCERTASPREGAHGRRGGCPTGHSSRWRPARLCPTALGRSARVRQCACCPSPLPCCSPPGAWPSPLPSAPWLQRPFPRCRAHPLPPRRARRPHRHPVRTGWCAPAPPRAAQRCVRRLPGRARRSRRQPLLHRSGQPRRVRRRGLYCHAVRARSGRCHGAWRRRARNRPSEPCRRARRRGRALRSRRGRCAPGPVTAAWTPPWWPRAASRCATSGDPRRRRPGCCWERYRSAPHVRPCGRRAERVVCVGGPARQACCCVRQRSFSPDVSTPDANVIR